MLGFVLLHVYFFLLQVIWKYYYDTSSSGEHGTLYQLRNLLNNTNVGKIPKHKFNSCDDFIDTIVTGHILCAALQTLGMVALDDQPSDCHIPTPETAWTLSKDERRTLLMSISKLVVKNHISCSFNKPHTQSGDDIHEYTTSLLSVGCMYLLFKDAIREGDGKRVLEYYRYLLPIFINSGRRNYANESLNLLCQYHYDLPQHQAEQLVWSRFVNAAGVKGGNIPADLHLEHLNRTLKGTIQGLGTNKNETAIVRASKAIGIIKDTIQKFDQENSITSSSGSHGAPAIKKELDIIVKELQQYQAFAIQCGRKHPSFDKPFHVIHAKPTKDIVAWVVEHVESRYFKQNILKEQSTE